MSIPSFLTKPLNQRRNDVWHLPADSQLFTKNMYLDI